MQKKSLLFQNSCLFQKFYAPEMQEQVFNGRSKIALTQIASRAADRCIIASERRDGKYSRDSARRPTVTLHKDNNRSKYGKRAAIKNNCYPFLSRKRLINPIHKRKIIVVKAVPLIRMASGCAGWLIRAVFGGTLLGVLFEKLAGISPEALWRI